MNPVTLPEGRVEGDLLSGGEAEFVGIGTLQPILCLVLDGKEFIAGYDFNGSSRPVGVGSGVVERGVVRWRGQRR